MGHNTARKGYNKSVKRLNKFPQGAPPSEKEALLLFKKPKCDLIQV